MMTQGYTVELRGSAGTDASAVAIDALFALGNKPEPQQHRWL